jgi:hypothetical protein
MEKLDQLTEQAKPHNLEAEVMASFIDDLCPNATESDINRAIQYAWNEWDL